MEVPDSVRRLALYPGKNLPAEPGGLRIDFNGFLCAWNPLPVAQVVELCDHGPSDLSDAVEQVRQLARENRKPAVGWLVTDEYSRFAPELERLGLRNMDLSGYEAVVTAMALVKRPAWTGGDDVDVREIVSLDDLRAYDDVTFACFPFLDHEQKRMRAMLGQRWGDNQRPDSSTVYLLAYLNGRTVGAAQATCADAGVAMFGGAVVPDARGRGVYRALTLARWHIAESRRTPALTIMAGRLSRPIAERLGFVVVGQKRIYFDEIHQ